MIFLSKRGMNQLQKKLINVNYHAKEDKNKGIIRIFAHEKYSASFLLILINLKFEDYG